MHYRSTIAVLALTLIACGGENPVDPDIDPPDVVDMFTVGGTISGQNGAVTLSLNAMSQSFTTDDFTFTQTLASGASYAVFFVSSATGQECDVSQGIGVISANVTNVAVSCQDVEPELRFVDAEVTGHLAVGDFDGDGIEDIVITIRTLPGHAVGTNLDMYRLLFGTGNAGYTAPVDVARAGSSDSTLRGRHFAVADFDGDGIDDFGFNSGSGLEVFAVGATRAPQRIFGLASGGSPMVAIDSDLNGSPDLVSIVFGGSNLNYLNLFRSNGDGTFEAEEFIANRDDPEAQALDMGAPLNMVVGDFDDDGIEDLATLVQTGSGVDQGLALALMSGDGVGGFSYPTALDPISDDVFEGFFPFEVASKELAAGDFDGDGDLDLVLTSTTDFILLLTNDGGSFTESGRATVRLRPIHNRLADFDDDGILDLLVAHADSRDLVIAFGQGNGTFGTAAGGESEWLVFPLDQDAELYDIVVSDLDGDGALDVAVTENGTNPSDSGRGSVQLWLGPGVPDS